MCQQRGRRHQEDPKKANFSNTNDFLQTRKSWMDSNRKAHGGISRFKTAKQSQSTFGIISKLVLKNESNPVNNFIPLSSHPVQTPPIDAPIPIMMHCRIPVPNSPTLKPFSAITLLVSLLFLVGCLPTGETENQSGNDKGYVGIVDYLEIQNRVGIADQNRQKLEEFDAAQNQALSELFATLREQAAPLERQLGEETNEKKVTEIKNALGQLNLQYAQAQQEWTARRQLYIQQLGSDIHRALEPAMQAVCDRYGLKMILIKSDREGYVSPDVEMTDEVVDEWKRNPIQPGTNG